MYDEVIFYYHIMLLFSALNYGGIGSTIAHEITHAFDDMGRHFDSTGQLHDWWTETTKDHFDERAQCFVTQYGSTYDDQAKMLLNGNLTLAENIADAGGLKGAFKAYQGTRVGKIEKTLPNLEHYTGNQLYFIASALVKSVFAKFIN
ncbi:neprilysin-1-like [Ixodes scapularis]|uniref:neprilysin-1-like n=1 Tax=Ixodes scapularis TaxID=6945 RepID=UPI001C393106|nr:neprilysin-1-like [Ixodes scapularis]